jgi:hypothetical protein
MNELALTTKALSSTTSFKLGNMTLRQYCRVQLKTRTSIFILVAKETNEGQHINDEMTPSIISLLTPNNNVKKEFSRRI